MDDYINNNFLFLTLIFQIWILYSLINLVVFYRSLMVRYNFSGMAADIVIICLLRSLNFLHIWRMCLVSCSSSPRRHIMFYSESECADFLRSWQLMVTIIWLRFVENRFMIIFNSTIKVGVLFCRSFCLLLF